MSRDIAKALKSFKKADKNSYTVGFKNLEEWHEALDKMIYVFEILDKDKWGIEDEAKILEGLHLFFFKYYMDLWD